MSQREVSDMGKLIFYIIIAALIYWIIKNRQPKEEKTETLAESIEDMVSCTHCGVHLPRSEAISSHHNQYFCCNEHRNLHTSSLS